MSSIRRLFSLVVSGRYVGTQKWFLDKEVHHQKDYLEKTPHSRFKPLHEGHKQQKEAEADAEHTERYTKAMERLKERLTK